jgi:hypothetical protein
MKNLYELHEKATDKFYLNSLTLECWLVYEITKITNRGPSQNTCKNYKSEEINGLIRTPGYPRGGIRYLEGVNIPC